MHIIHQIIKAEMDSRQQNTHVVGVRSFLRVIKRAETKLKMQEQHPTK
jgi:ribosomal protein L4